MAASLERIGIVSSRARGVFYLVLSLPLLLAAGAARGAADGVPCGVHNCTCRDDSVDCRNLDLSSMPLDLPVGTVSL